MIFEASVKKYKYKIGLGGCEIDLVQAMFWYRKSAAQGFQRAIENVERLS